MCYNILLYCIHIESTDGNFGTCEKVATPISIVTCTLPIPIFGTSVIPFPWIPMVIPWEWESHSHAHLYTSPVDLPVVMG